MKLHRMIPMILALMVVVAGCSSGGSTAAGSSTGAGGSSASGEVTLTMNPKEGDTYTYVTKIGDAAQAVEMTMSMKAAKVTADDILMETKFDSMSMGGQPMPPQVMDSMKKMVIKTTMDHMGKTLKTEVEGAPPGAEEQFKNSGNSTPTAYPGHAIKVGDTWTADTNVQGMPVKMTYKLTKVEDVNGMNAAIIECTPDGTTKVKFDGPMTMSIEVRSEERRVGKECRSR